MTIILILTTIYILYTIGIKNTITITKAHTTNLYKKAEPTITKGYTKTRDIHKTINKKVSTYANKVDTNNKGGFTS